MADEVNPDIDTTESDYDILNSDTSKEPKDKKDAVIPKEEVSEETDEAAEEGEETPEEAESEDNTDEEEKVDDVPDTKIRPSIKTMLDKVPEAAKLFKEFPQLRDAYFREAKFTEIYPTLEDATEAKEKSDALDTYNDFIEDGNSGAILKAIADDDPDKLKKFASNFLPALHKINNDLFYDVSIPVINQVIRNLHRSGEKNGDKEGQNQMAAAKILSKFLHGSYDIPDDTKQVDPELDSERKRLDKERNEFKNQKYQDFESGLQTRTEKLLNKVILDGLDPEKSLSEFTKSKIVEEVISRIGKELNLDKAHMSTIGKLWKAAESSRFSNESADRILSAFLSRAKQLIPEIRNKVKKEATGAKQRSNNGTGRTTNKDVNTGTHTGRSTSSKTETDPKKINWRKTSDLDLLK